MNMCTRIEKKIWTGWEKFRLSGVTSAKGTGLKLKQPQENYPGLFYVISELFYSATTSNGISTETSL